jgi:regulator of extracellular matrix RemA (YlzA/DUF370 family)
MSYTIPLRFIRISHKRSDNRQFDVAICATRIVAIMSTEIYQARKTISDERKNGTLINGCGLTKAQSAIFLDNGTVVTSPMKVKRLMALIEKSNEKAGSKLDKRMRVYDVYDSEPNDDDEEMDELDAEYDSQDETAEYDEYFDEDDFE